MRGGARSGQYRRGPDRARRRRNGRCAGRGRGRGRVPGPRPRRSSRLAARRRRDVRRPDAGPARAAGRGADRRRPPGRGVARARTSCGTRASTSSWRRSPRAGVHQHRDARTAASSTPRRSRTRSSPAALPAAWRDAPALAVRAGRGRAAGRVGRRARRATRWSRSAGRACCGSSWPASGSRSGRPGRRRSCAGPISWASAATTSVRGCAESTLLALPASGSHDAVHGRRARRRGDRGAARMAALPGAGRGRRSRSSRFVDPVGAGDTFLAGVFAAHVDPSLRRPGARAGCGPPGRRRRGVADLRGTGPARRARRATRCCGGCRGRAA